MVVRYAAAVAVAAALITSVIAEDYDLKRHIVKHHSLTTPMLANYWDGGIGFWSFGFDAVTTDEYVRLTLPKVTSAAGVKDIAVAAPPRNSVGYLWNQVPSDLMSWRAQFRLSMSESLHYSLFRQECQTCGVAFWYMEEPIRHSEYSFFGVPPTFKGLGVVIRPDGTLYVVHNNGDQHITDSSLPSFAIGSCSVAVGQAALDIAIDFERDGPVGNGRLVVWSAAFGAAQHTTCVTATVDLQHRYYYGFTAHSAVAQPMAYDVTAVQVTSLYDEKDPEKLEKGAADFDAAMDKKLQTYWNGRGDTTPFT